MIQRHRVNKTAFGQDGYALIAALLILLLMTAFGIWAMLTSSSESVLSGNINEEQLMFFFAEQGIDRILSHLHYMDQGLYGQVLGLGYPYEGNSNTLDPINAIATRRVLQYSSGSLSTSPLFDLTAYIDPKDYEYSMQRPATRPLAINVKIDNKVTDYTKAFRVFVQPRSIWDFAYYSNNHNPSDRSYGTCANSSYQWYDCQTVFHGGRSITSEEGTFYQPGEKIQGDIYIRNEETNPDTGKLFVRGWPEFSGQVLFRSVVPFDMGTYTGSAFTDSTNQTKGGKSVVKQPAARDGMIYNARDIEMFPIDYLTADPDDTRYYRGNADITLKDPGTNYIWKIMFRNDLATDEPNEDDPCQEEYRVGSAITKKTNNGNIDCPGNEGVFLLYKLPWNDDPDNRIYWSTDSSQRAAAYYGDTMFERDQAMLAVGGERWKPGVSWGADVDPTLPRNAERINADSSNHTFGIYDPSDIRTPSTAGFGYRFMYVPTQGGDCGAEGTCNGIIVVEGSVMVSGVLDGKVTIVALGDIILDHEIEYEDYNMKVCDGANGTGCNFSSPDGVDMLGLFATGNIIIPNTLPKKTVHGPVTYEDDWSDSEYSGKLYAPTGIFDSKPYEQRSDDGTEDIHAVMVSFGYGPCDNFSSNTTCEDPKELDIRQFQVGLYAFARTANRRPNGAPYDNVNGTWNDMGNDSGTLRIKGALIQNIPGRVGYDYNGSAAWAKSTCEDGGGGGACNYIGHRMELFYDDRLHYTAPVTPRASGTSRYFPYGRAAYEILSWEEMRNPEEMNLNIW